MAYLVQTNEGQSGAKFALEKNHVSIGRSPDCDIYLDDPSVSHEHAVVTLGDLQSDAFFRLQDAGSTNGTYVNNEKVERVTLRHNDTIVIGLSNFRFVDEGHIAMERTQQIQRSWIPGIFYLKDKK